MGELVIGLEPILKPVRESVFNKVPDFTNEYSSRNFHAYQKTS